VCVRPWVSRSPSLRSQPGSKKAPARVFKPEARQKIESKGCRIVLNIGDQASDLAGCCAEWVFKLPNPFYFDSVKSAMALW
jgi:hypothetical protein